VNKFNITADNDPFDFYFAILRLLFKYRYLQSSASKISSIWKQHCKLLS